MVGFINIAFVDVKLKIFKLFHIDSASMKRHPRFTVLVHFGSQFTAVKPKILLKPKISAKTESLAISNAVSLRSQKISEFY